MRDDGVEKKSPWFYQTVDDKKYPSLSRTETADVAIIGGGMAGVMAAWHLIYKAHFAGPRRQTSPARSRSGHALAQKNLKVILLEKNRMATGDTGASTGFLTRVPDVALHELAEKYGVDFVKKVFEASRRNSLSALRGIFLVCKNCFHAKKLFISRHRRCSRHRRFISCYGLYRILRLRASAIICS